MVLSLLTSVLLLVLLFWHYRLGQIRYFDVDEFAHLSWAYQMLSGRRPYVDFFFFFPPGFHVFLMPLFALGNGITPILAGRLVQFAIFVVLVGVTMLLFWLVRRSWTAILAGVFLAFLPLPFDKFLEIRPDTLATLFAMAGMALQILALKGLTLRGRVRPYQILAGFFYGVSLLILPKTAPQVGVAIAVALLAKRSRPLLVGFAIPMVLFGLWMVSLGNIDQVLYSLINLPVEANKISKTFVMMPDLFFYPNQIFYGMGGWNWGLLVNHVLWILAVFVGAYRLVTPGKSWEEFLIAASFVIQVIFYIIVVPLKHSQYLIPISVFVAFYSADAVDMLWKKIIGVKSLAAATFFTLFIIGLGGLWQVFVEVNSPKLAWTNGNDVKNLTMMYQIIPKGEYVLDLTGESLYYNHPYYACCIPFGQSAPYLSRPLPSLWQALEKTQTRYIVEGGVKRVGTLLPADQAYVSVHYLPHPTIAGLLERK